MKCEILIRRVDDSCAVRFGWCVATTTMVVRSKTTVKHKKTALRQARRVAKRLGMEVGK